MLYARVVRVRVVKCHACGGHKQLPSQTAYVYCDFCGALSDWDFAMACSQGNALPGPAYEALHRRLAPAIKQAEWQGDRATVKALYTQLVASGQPSLVAALTVGATIEDLDIHDIEAMRANTTDPAILATYAALECGSRNHMRAFYGFLTANGGSYRAQFITQAELDAIIAGAHEQCGMGTGPGRRGMGRRGGWR